MKKLINILISGACGKMGQKVAEVISKKENIKVICGIDKTSQSADFPIYSSFDEVSEKPDAIIDFSHISVLEGLLDYATKHKIPAILATTGYSNEQKLSIEKAAAKIPVFYTANMSIGVNLLCALASKAAAMLGEDFDVEIIEKHHNQKIDAPSGTALMLANAVNSQFNDSYSYEYDRHSRRIKRPKNEIGIHSVRGGTIVGEHDVIFAGRDEVITLSHSAASKEIFAVGAVRAAEFIIGKDAGLYDMNDILHIC